MNVGNLNDFIFTNQIVVIYKDNVRQYRGVIYNRDIILKEDYLLYKDKEIDMIASSVDDELVIHIK